MPSSISEPAPVSSNTTTTPDSGVSRLRTVTGNRWRRTCACDSAKSIARDRVVLRFVESLAKEFGP